MSLVSRGVGLGELRVGDWWRIMRRELAGGFMLGTILGVIGFLRIVIWSRFSHIYDPSPLLVATTVGAALVGIVLWGSLMGSMLPLILKNLWFVPAPSSTPLCPTLDDVTAHIIYSNYSLFI